MKDNDQTVNISIDIAKKKWGELEVRKLILLASINKSLEKLVKLLENGRKSNG